MFKISIIIFINHRTLKTGILFIIFFLLKHQDIDKLDQFFNQNMRYEIRDQKLIQQIELLVNILYPVGF